MRPDITPILRAMEQGDERAAEELLPIVYEELRALAQHRMSKESPGQTLQATALVHEAYLRLLGPEGAASRWDSEAHFFGAAAEAMRRILIDRARAKGAKKRGGGRARIELTLDRITLDAVPDEILDLDEALQRLEEEAPEMAELVSLRFFAGLTLKQAASVLGISSATADRRWAYAQAWLFDEVRFWESSLADALPVRRAEDLRRVARPIVQALFGEHIFLEPVLTALAAEHSLPDDVRRTAERLARVRGEPSALLLNNIAWDLVDPFREDKQTDVVHGLRLTRWAVERGPGEATIRDTLAWALLANGLYDEALAESEQALQLAPEERRDDFEETLDDLRERVEQLHALQAPGEKVGDADG